MRRFEGRAVLVTGGAGAIGRAAAARFAAEGGAVAVADRDGPGAEAVAASLPRAVAVAGDLAEEAAAEAAVAATLSAFGRIDVLFANAGVAGAPAPVQALAPAEWDRVMAANLRSMFLTLAAAARAMTAAGRGGAIVTMGSSMAGWDVLAGGAAYLASKHAVVGLTRAAAIDLAPYGIRVNAVCPGVIETGLGLAGAAGEAARAAARRFADRIPLRRIGQAEDVAAAVAFLASDEAAHVTGAAWLIDGGQTLQSWANAPDGAYPRHLPAV